MLLPPTLLTIALSATSLVHGSDPADLQGTESLTPPGLLELNGGTTVVGSTPKEIQILVDTIPGAASALRVLDAETPQRRIAVTKFYYGVTELTHEQYAAFARATGYRPLQDWGAKAIEAGRLAWFEEMNTINEQRRAEGKPVLREKFDTAAWWEENWKDSEWDVPDDIKLMPVTHVNFADAEAYCAWAGVRLPTEEEYQHAVRGSGKDPYPWGDEWETGKYCGTSEVRGHAKPYQVAHFEEGKSKEGLYELSGNVWEWTSSPYIAPEKFKKNTYKVEGEKKSFSPRWNGNKRIVVGGSFQNPRFAARCTVRRATPRDEVTNAMGFRIAASTGPGMDMARSLFNSKVKHSDFRPEGVTYAPDQVIAKDRWIAETNGEGSPDNYGIIGDYQYVLFVPLAELEETQDASFRRDSLSLLAPLGFLCIKEPMLQPALAPGNYFLSFRAAGETPEPKVEEGEEGEDDGVQAEPETPVLDSLLEGLNLDVDNLLLVDAQTGERAAGFEIPGMAFGKGEPGGSWSKIVKTHKEVDPNNPKKQIDVSEDWLRCDIRIGTKIRRRSLIFGLEMMPDPAHFTSKWRK
ncbi:MAG TPA: SUMF1/EgtB/PvdO family nonheme iron enzyme [Planctomycetota bacterium]|jgi:formylglycine-generating enzyme required for sulfatase activity|nr:SUMF1/EgtB/PvdO family nonheme iron enzyme [Planctomycetota bacterium]